MEAEQSKEKKILFKHWTSSFHFTSEGKHIIDFSKDFPMLISCNRFSFDRPLAPNYHDYLEISYICDGKGIFRVGNKDYPVKKGGIIVAANTEVHTLLINGYDPVDVISIFFMPELIYKPGGADLDFEYLRFFYHRDYENSNYIPADEIDSDRLFNLMFKCYQALKKGIKYNRLYVKNYLHEILLLILLYYEKSLVSGNDYHDKRISDIHRMTPVFRLVESRYQEKISLEHVASTVYMSPQYFCRFFKRVTGSTFMQYLQQIRIDRAKHLLLTSDFSITQVAYEVGFENLSYFNRVFKKFTLLTPSEFLRIVANKKNEQNK